MISCSRDMKYFSVGNYCDIEVKKNRLPLKYNWKFSLIFNYLDLFLGVIKYHEELIKKSSCGSDVPWPHENRAAMSFLAHDKTNDDLEVRWT